MDDVAQEALGALNGWLTSIMPVPGAGESLDLLVVPQDVALTGIGAHVGMNDEPYGEIVGRRIRASAEIAVSAAQNALGPAVSNLLETVLTQDRADLRANGVYRVALNELGPVSLSGMGANITARRSATFDILFEYIREPVSMEGVIAELPLELDISLGGTPTYLINGGFTADFLSDFDVVDDDQVTQFAPSDWNFNAGESRLEQMSRIRGGGLQPTVTKAGTALVRKTTAAVPPVDDFVLTALLSSSSQDGIGLVFRWQDPDNFYYFLASARHNYRLMGKKVNGVFAFLDVPALDESNGFTVDTPFSVKIIGSRSRFSVFIDGQAALSGEDQSITQPGRVGLMCHGNNAAFFTHMKLIGFL